MHPVYTTKLGFHTRKIDISTQKTNGSHLNIFGRVIVDCLVKNKLERVRFFQEASILANISLEMIVKMFFLNFSKADIWFMEWDLVWKIYMAVEALPTTGRVKIIDKSKFVATALNKNNETFVVHVVALAKPTTMPIYFFCQVQVAMLMSERTRILAEYFEFSNVFSSDSAAELLEHTRINDYLINLLDNKQPPYDPI